MTAATSIKSFRGIPVLIAALFLSVTNAQAIETPAKNAYIIDMKTGTILFDKNSDEPMPPASMSKLMTVYMVFERLKDGPRICCGASSFSRAMTPVLSSPRVLPAANPPSRIR
jgi:D-alanyl-D-alanine carboxypeptidase